MGKRLMRSPVKGEEQVNHDCERDIILSQNMPWKNHLPRLST